MHREASSARSQRQPQVDVVIPVYNEERVLASKIQELHDYLSATMHIPWRIIIADNASTDQTGEIAKRLGDSLQNVYVLHIASKGRGLALKTAWSQSQASVMAYMDVDLSTNLNSFLPLIAPILSGHSDISIGTRLRRGARVSRRFKREFISRSYNLLVKAIMRSHFSDAQCGFKAISARAARLLLPQIVNNTWFFDTELLLLAEHMGLRIFEVPVDWTEDLDSRVNIPRTIVEDLQGLWRMRLTLWLRRDALRDSDALLTPKQTPR
jgi:glycosyltransferase involved in cell wall biosynthesis